MDYKNLKDTPIEEIISQVTELSAVGAKHQLQSIMAIPAKCSMMLLEGLETFNKNTHAQASFIGGEIRKFNKGLEESIQQFDASSSKISKSLARATWALVFVTAVLVIVTGLQIYLRK